MPRPMGLFAASARRRVCSRWSGTWIASRKSVGFSPVEIRRRNFLKPGQTTTTEQIVREPIDLGQLLDRALELSDYRAKKQRFAKENEAGASRKGMGIAAFLHGAGFTGSGERYLSSVVGVEGCADGRVRVLVSSTEFGQGTKTVLCQIAAETLGCRTRMWTLPRRIRNEVPNSGPTVASRTVMVVGKLVQSAALGIKQTLMASGLLASRTLPKNFAPPAGIMLRRTGIQVVGALRGAERCFLGR